MGIALGVEASIRSTTLEALDVTHPNVSVDIIKATLSTLVPRLFSDVYTRPVVFRGSILSFASVCLAILRTSCVVEACQVLLGKSGCWQGTGGWDTAVLIGIEFVAVSLYGVIRGGNILNKSMLPLFDPHPRCLLCYHYKDWTPRSRRRCHVSPGHPALVPPQAAN